MNFFWHISLKNSILGHLLSSPIPPPPNPSRLVFLPWRQKQRDPSNNETMKTVSMIVDDYGDKGDILSKTYQFGELLQKTPPGFWAMPQRKH